MIVTALIGMAASVPGDALQPVGRAYAAVDPRVLEDLAQTGEADFLVVLKTKADLGFFQSRIGAGLALPLEARRTGVPHDLQAVAQKTQASLAAYLDQIGVVYQSYWLVNAMAVRGGEELIQMLRSRPEVAAIDSNRAVKVDLPEPESLTPDAAQADLWNLDKIRARVVWDIGATGQGIVYANSDTGVRWDHPALIGQYRGGNGAGEDHAYDWWDAVHGDINGTVPNVCKYSTPAPCDDEGHGTHTTGIGVGGSLTDPLGVAPGAEWIACRNMDDGVGRPTTYIECLQFFMAPTDLGGSNPNPAMAADVVGNSYACPPSEQCNPHDLRQALDAMRAAGIFMAVSAGNSGPGCSTIKDPPALEDASVTVGASNDVDGIAGFSSRGPVRVGSEPLLLKPDLVAPGVGIFSTYVSPDYAYLQGTSMAAPHVAGAVALLWSAFPTLRGDVETTEQLLKDSAVHLTTNEGCGGDGVNAVPNNVYGYGRLDVLKAYQLYANWQDMFLPLILR